jgi:hypothetical protein
LGLFDRPRALSQAAPIFYIFAGSLRNKFFRIIPKMFHVKHFCPIARKNPATAHTKDPCAAHPKVAKICAIGKLVSRAGRGWPFEIIGKV